MEVTVLTPKSSMVAAQQGERTRVTGLVLSNEVETTLLLPDDEAAIVMCGMHSNRQVLYLGGHGNNGGDSEDQSGCEHSDRGCDGLCAHRCCSGWYQCFFEH